MASYKKLGWTAANVRCPFYIKDSRENKSISCEGHTEGCIEDSRFKNIELKEKHMGCYCVGRYEACPVYKSTYEAKYREEGDKQ